MPRKRPLTVRSSSPTADVLLTIDEYQKLAGGQHSIVELLAMPGAGEIEFEPQQAEDLFRPADLS